MSLRNSFHQGRIIILVPVGFILIGYIIYPGVLVLWESLFRDGVFGLGNYSEFFNIEHPSYIEGLLNSILVSVGSVLISALIGVPLGIIFTHYNFPGRALFSKLAMLPIALPPLVGVLAFLYLYSESGMVPRLIQEFLGLDHVPFSLDGVWAVLLVHGYTMYVFFYLFTAAALKNIDPAINEAAQNLGASSWYRFRKITFPLLIPAFVGATLLVFMTSMNSFSAPFIFGGGVRFLSLNIYTSKLNGDMAMAVTQTVILSTLSIGFLFLMRFLEGRRHYTMGTKGISVFRNEIQGRWRRLSLGATGIVMVVVLLLPHLTILLLSFVQDGTWTYQVFPTIFTGDNYSRLFQDPQVWEPIRNSLSMALISTGADVLIGVGVAYVVVKGTFRGRKILDALVMVPWALPGTVVAINLIVAFSQGTPFSFGQVLVGSFWLLPIAYFIRHLPIVFRASSAAFRQIDSSLEEAARNLGAGWFYSFRRITLPLIGPGVLAGTLLAFVTALGEFVASILLYVYDNRPIAIEILSHLRQFNIGSAAAYGVLLLLLVSVVLIASNYISRDTAQRSLS